AGQPVVLDAAFLATEQRQGAAGVASRRGVPLLFVETVCDEATTMARLAARSAGASASDATGAIYQRQRAAVASAPPALPAGAWIIQVDTKGDSPRWLEAVFARLVREDIVLPLLPTGGPQDQQTNPAE
ncbi:MAG TPA: AAA family ATPase, partial [Thermomicrobiales bacterium]|nr:AAA family ATPase [Thermomicrobiales bacterium]